MVTVIARRLAISRTHFYRLREQYATVAEALDDERESLKDLAESKLVQNIKAGDNTAIIFYLKTQAKERGYTERIDFRVQQQVETELESIFDALQSSLTPEVYAQALHAISGTRPDHSTAQA